MEKKILTLGDVCGAQVRRWLRRGNVHTLEDLLELTQDEVASIYNIGHYRLDVILSGLKHHGLRLKGRNECYRDDNPPQQV